MPIVYERAAGGSDTSNPVGMRVYAADTHGAIGIPNLQPPGLQLHQRGEWVPPIGYGPIAPTWPSRAEKLGQRNVNFAQAIRYDSPLPEGIDARFFNVAPEDQQTTTLRADERIVLENLHQEHARLVTNLPGFTPRAVVERNGSTEEVTLAADTLWIDTDRGQCTLVWRGHISLAHASELGRIVITMNEPGAAARTAPSHTSPPQPRTRSWMTRESLAAPRRWSGIRPWLAAPSCHLFATSRRRRCRDGKQRRPPFRGHCLQLHPFKRRLFLPRRYTRASAAGAGASRGADTYASAREPVGHGAGRCPTVSHAGRRLLLASRGHAETPTVSVSEAARLGVASASTAAASAERSDRAEPVEQPRQTQSPKTSAPAIPRRRRRKRPRCYGLTKAKQSRSSRISSG